MDIEAARKDLIRFFQSERSVLRALDEQNNDITVEKDDEVGLANSAELLKLRVKISNQRVEKIKILDIMIKEIPTWNFQCAICRQCISPERVKSSLSMVCVSCKEVLEMKEKRANGRIYELS